MVVKKMQTQGLGNEIFRKSFNRFVQVNERSRLYLPRRERLLIIKLKVNSTGKHSMDLETHCASE